jgi:hypothetical protein
MYGGMAYVPGNEVPPARFERTAPGLGILCSIHLSYGGEVRRLNELGLARPLGAEDAELAPRRHTSLPSLLTRSASDLQERATTRR